MISQRVGESWPVGHGTLEWTQIVEEFTFLLPGSLPILERDAAEKQRIKATCLPLSLTFLAQ